MATVGLVILGLVGLFVVCFFGVIAEHEVKTWWRKRKGVEKDPW